MVTFLIAAAGETIGFGSLAGGAKTCAAGVTTASGSAVGKGVGSGVGSGVDAPEPLTILTATFGDEK